VVIASYFTYLSKLPFLARKTHLDNWFAACPSLSALPLSQRVGSVC
jgi:hypothetical protein